MTDHTIGATPVVPTLVVYIGNAVDTTKVRANVESRLYEYVAAGIVLSTSIETSVLREAVLPGFDSVFGIENSLRFHGGDAWLAYGVAKQTLRVLVCVLDAACDVVDLKHLYEQIQHRYNVNGVQVQASLMWCRSQSVSESGLAFIPQMYVNPDRLQDVMGIVEHGIVLWVTTGLSDRVHNTIAELHATNTSKNAKKIKAIWLSAASIYVDISYILEALRTRVYDQFMRAWRSNEPTTQAKDEIQSITTKKASEYNAHISDMLLQMYQRLGWIIKSQDVFVYRQTRLVDDDMSGFPRVDTPFAKGMFGNAVGWWLGHWSTQAPSLLVGIRDKVRMVFNRSVELDVPNHQTIARAIKTQYQEVHIRMRDDLQVVNEQVYRDLQDFFFSHLLKYDDLDNRDYGLKRMLYVIQTYTNALEKPATVELYKQLTGKADVISPIPAVTEDYLDTVSNEHADRMQRLHLKWKRERASLLSFGGLIVRAIVIYPLLLSLLYAYAPAYFVEGPVTAILLAVGLVVVAVALYTWSYISYFANIERDRDRYFADVITPVMLSISTYYMNMYRQRLVIKLRRLYDVYSDIDIMINKHVIVAEMPVTNLSLSRQYVLRNVEMVFGNEMIRVDDKYQGDSWESMRNEHAWVYTANQHVYLSWRSLIKQLLNVQGRHRGRYKAEVTLLQELAELLFAQRRQGEIALRELRAKIDAAVASIAKPHEVALDVQSEQVHELGGGGKWCWLAEHANIDTVPRGIDGFLVHKYVYIVLNDATSLAGASGEHSACYRQYPPSGILLSRLGNEMSRIELEFDVTE